MSLDQYPLIFKGLSEKISGFSLNKLPGFPNNAENFDTKFWLDLGLKSFGLIVSFYGIYKLSKCFEALNDSNHGQKQKGIEVFNKLGIPIPPNLTNYELSVASFLIDTNSLDIDWKDIGGLENIVREINRSVLTPILTSDLFNSKLYKPPKGMLLYGPSGCGKTMLVKILAKTSNVRFLNIQPSSIMSTWMGETEKYIEAVFTLARKIQPTIIFIDEIDGLLSTRRYTTSSEVYLTTKTMFLSLWDGLLSDNNSKIIVVGATNRPLAIDDAIMRRLQIKIEIKLPDEREREAIFRVILKNENIDSKVNDDIYQYLSENSDQLSGSAIKDICHEALLLAVERFKNTSQDSSSEVTIESQDLIASLEMYKKKINTIKKYTQFELYS